MHIRRGDVASDPERHSGRLTSDAVYAKAVATIVRLIEADNSTLAKFRNVVRGRVRVHVFSQGNKVLIGRQGRPPAPGAHATALTISSVACLCACCCKFP